MCICCIYDTVQGVGNWEIPLSSTVLESNWPDQTLKGLGEQCHAGPDPVGFVVWFEPERVAPGTYIANTFPQYVLHTGNQHGPQTGQGLINLGNEQARQYIKQYLSYAVAEYGLDVLRMDFNVDPAPIWASSDEQNRSGMREVKYINGLYIMWDEILATYPNLIIDDCASGGRRIDIETLSRSVPLWRSDYAGSASADGATALQVQSMGLTQLAPISSGAVWDVDPYNWRSAGIFGKTISWGYSGWQRIIANATLVAQLKLAIAETKSLREFELEDYYPLTHTTLDLSQWAGYQFHRPPKRYIWSSTIQTTEAGFAMYFRRPSSSVTSMVSGLLALADEGKYEVSMFHGYQISGPVTKYSGTELSSLRITLEPNQSLLLRYRRTA